MNIRWYGQACFRIEGKDISILIDPFSKEIGLKPPKIADTIVLISHEHTDHNSLAGAPEGTFVIREPGEFEKSGVYVQGILSYHDDSKGLERGYNTIFIITFEDMRICHLGDIGQATLTDEQVQEIGDIDLLFIPVGGVYTINGVQAAKMVQQIQPKIVIPMHYKIDGLAIDIEDSERFIKELGLTPEEAPVYKISKKTLPMDEIKLITMTV